MSKPTPNAVSTSVVLRSTRDIAELGIVAGDRVVVEKDALHPIVLLHDLTPEDGVLLGLVTAGALKLLTPSTPDQLVAELGMTPPRAVPVSRSTKVPYLRILSHGEEIAAVQRECARGSRSEPLAPPPKKGA